MKRYIFAVIILNIASLLAIANPPANYPTVTPSAKSTLDWKPVVEQGKTWKYTFYFRICHGPIDWEESFVFPASLSDPHVMSLKIDGVTEIDGIEYANVLAILPDYFQDYSENSPSEPILYIRDDLNSNTLYFRFNENYKYYYVPWTGILMRTPYDNDQPPYDKDYTKEFPAFSMINIFDNLSFSIDRFHNDWDGLNINKFSYSSPCDETLNGYKINWNDKEMTLIESIGYVDHAGIFLYGLYQNMIWSTDYSRFNLYEVTGGDGRVLYFDERYKPSDDSIENIEADNEEQSVDYFDLQGRKVERPEHGIVIERSGSSAKVKSL